MKIIDKIEIRYFRSIKSGPIVGLSDLNIFSGKNDSGKSNILKALNLFFNSETDFQRKLDFDQDFSKERAEEVRKDSIRGKQFIAIKIYFNRPISFNTLPDKFYIEKIWDRNGIKIWEKDNVIDQFKRGKIPKAKTEERVKATLSMFLNSVHYIYVPAVRAPKIFDNLLEILQEVIISKQSKDKNINSLLENINKESSRFTEKISQDFKRVSGISSSIRIPTEFKELFNSFFIDTESGNFSLPLRLRGDGIQMRYIPTILDYIARYSRGIFIWGFDEPENSTEYSLCADMAKDFKENFSANSQILISTHSFNFVSLNGPNIAKYLVCKDENGISSKIVCVENENGKHLSQGLNDLDLYHELGALEFHEKMAKEYDNWKKTQNDFFAEHRRLRAKIAADNSKPILCVEGATDIDILEEAWKRLRPTQIIPIKFYNALDRNALGNLFLRDEIYAGSPEICFIGMLDFDDAYDNWQKLLQESRRGSPPKYEEISGRGKKEGLLVKHILQKGYVFLLPVPDFRVNYADKNFKSYLSIELLFEDRLLSGFVNDCPIAGGVVIKKIKDAKKAEFAAKVKTFETSDFVSFEPVFKLIESISGNEFA